MGKEILVDERRWRLRDENDFQSVKEWEAFEERVNNMINSGSQIVKLPQELTWSGIKSALQAMYRKPSLKSTSSSSLPNDWITSRWTERQVSANCPRWSQRCSLIHCTTCSAT